jgi:hypothetical protein
MGRMNIEDPKARGFRGGGGFLFEGMDFVPVGSYTITDKHPPYIRLAPAGAVNVLMPTSTPAKKGMIFIVKNAGAGALTFQTDGGAGFTVALTAATTVLVRLICTGSTTQAAGWEFW